MNGNRELGTGMLNNELYVGQLVWNRLAYRKDPETNRLRRAAASDRDRLEVELAGITRRIRTVVSAIAEGTPPKTLLAELRRIQARQEEIERALSRAPSAPAPLIHPNVSAIYARKVAEVHHLLESPETREAATETIRALIDKMVPTPVAGELQVDLHGELAAILWLCQGSK